MKKFILILLLIISLSVLAALVLNLMNGGVWIIEGLNGANGTDGKDGINGTDGRDGQDGEDGKDGKDGENGKSAYELALEDGFQGTLHEWLLSLSVQGGNGGAVVPSAPAVSVEDVRINENGFLIVTLTDGTELNAGYVGSDGFSSESVDEQGFKHVYEMVVMNAEASLLNLREEPDTAANIVAAIPSGTELLRVGYNEVTGWTRLIYNDEVCYAKAKYFDLKYTVPEDVPTMNLPDHIVLTVGVEAWFVTEEILPNMGAEYSIGYAYSGMGTRTYDGKVSFSLIPAWRSNPNAAGHKPEQETLTVTLSKCIDGEYTSVFEKTVDVTVVAEQGTLTLTGLVIGDSRISDGTLVTALDEAMTNLTLLGTRSVRNSGVAHEGRGAWSTAHYMELESLTVGTEEMLNAFYNPGVGGFDFSYYMQNNYAGQSLDFVVINLGANDQYSQSSVDNLLKMARSVRAYAQATGQNTRVLIMTEYLSPDDGYFLSQSSNVNVEARRNLQFRYFAYMDEVLGDLEEEGIYLVPNYLCIDFWSDRFLQRVTTSNGEELRITDLVHLGRNGYLKEAAMLRAYLYWIFGVQAS